MINVVTKNNLGSSFRLDTNANKVFVDSIGDRANSIRYKEVIGAFAGFVSKNNSSLVLAEDFSGSTVSTDNPTLTRIHFRLPTVYTSPAMYRLHFVGYSLGSSQVIDTTVAGYAYTDRVMQSLSKAGTHVDSIYQYIGSDGHVYIRFDLPNLYYTTIRIDSMGVGNGAALQKGTITAIFDARDEV